MPRNRRHQPASRTDGSSALKGSWKWLAGVVLAALATIIAGYIADANHWILGKIEKPAPALTASVTLLSPGDLCDGEQGWVFPVDLRHLLPPGPNESEDVWARANHGIPASGYYISVVLQPPAQQTVVVTDLRVEVTERRKAPSGAAPRLGGGCGGLVPNLFKANLDTVPARVLPTSGVDLAGKRIPAVALPHVLSETSPEVWKISAVTKTCDCDWVAYIDYTVDGNKGSIRIDDHGRPFRTASAARTGPPVVLTRSNENRPEWQNMRGQVIKMGS